jgi:adenylate cyclase class IV
MDTRYLEIEQKYKADHVDWDRFCELVSSFKPKKKLRIMGPDTYYEHKAVPSVLRWRHSADKEEITFKTRLGLRSAFLRNEIDWDLTGTPIKGVLKGIRMMGYHKAFRLYKDCQIFWLSDKEGSVSVVIYDVFCKNFKNKRFIEIEAEKGQDYKLSKKLVRLWESRLGLHINKRVTKSLYEIYSGKMTPIPDSETFCGSCARILPLKFFCERKNGKVKPGDVCRDCTSIRNKSSKRKAEKKLWREKTVEARASYMLEYRKKNKDKLKKQASIRQAERYKEDLVYKISLLLRSRLSSALKSKKAQKNSTTKKLIGMSYEDFKTYIESKFYDDPISGQKMTWENWGNGRGKWQLDHVIPLASFNLKNPDELALAARAENIRPLWFDEHLQKSIKERQLYRHDKDKRVKK